MFLFGTEVSWAFDSNEDINDLRGNNIGNISSKEYNKLSEFILSPKFSFVCLFFFFCLFHNFIVHPLSWTGVGGLEVLEFAQCSLDLED